MYMKMHTICLFVYNAKKIIRYIWIIKLKLYKLILESETVYILK